MDIETMMAQLRLRIRAAIARALGFDTVEGIMKPFTKAVERLEALTVQREIEARAERDRAFSLRVQAGAAEVKAYDLEDAAWEAEEKARKLKDFLG